MPRRAASDDPDLIFRKSTVFRLMTPNDKLATYAIDDPLVDGVACHYTVPEKGGLAGAFSLAEQTSDISLSCRQYAAVKFKEKFEQGDIVFQQRRSAVFKKMQVVRGLRRQAQHPRLHGLYRQAHRRLAEEFHIDGARAAMGRGRRCAALRRLAERMIGAHPLAVEVRHREGPG